MSPINITDELDRIGALWSPRVIAELNGQQVKLARIEGTFEWHAHAREDELFMVVEGELTMEFRDRTETVRAGEIIVVPAGVEHRPRAERETHIMLFEPASTKQYGDGIVGE